ncbi:glycine-rich domain-containing protein [Alkalilacustris brevis]|uniref:glycine-rich domain-containing protein n=1 Tax=Alkalilacustris brevis TaxID=2026338 RepID=UPI000E0D50B6|nr:hypothetical protein [Alkalilacustris brevis]
MQGTGLSFRSVALRRRFRRPSAEGGTETVIQDGSHFYRVHTYLASAPINILRGGRFEFLVVGAGAGGGRAGSRGAAGGGAGGFRKWVAGEADNSEAGPLFLPVGAQSVEVGIGGAGATSTTGQSDPGEHSSVSNIISEGGGRAPGSQITDPVDKDGASGGGGNQEQENFEGGSGIPGQGHDGGDGTVNQSGGGGGGAGGPGGDAKFPDNIGGDGGLGLPSAISGASTIYAPGGRGTGSSVNGAVAPGYGNPGSGGNGNNGGSGAAGADGIVILRYRITEAEYLNEVA